MNIETKNTVDGIKEDIKAGKRTLKSIAQECRIFENQVSDDENKAIFARLSDCTTRAQFKSVIDSLE